MFYVYKNNDCVTIDINTVSSVVMYLELGKPSGFDEITAEHLKYAHPCVLSIFNLLFNRILKEDLVPDDFARGLTVPIPTVTVHETCPMKILEG